MSVQVNQYIGFGYYLPYDKAIAALEEKHGEDGVEELMDKYHDSAFKKEIKKIDDMSMIVDGMSAEFIYFGHVAAKGTDEEPLSSMVMKQPSTEIIDKMKTQFVEIFGQDFNMSPSFTLVTLYR